MNYLELLIAHILLQRQKKSLFEMLPNIAILLSWFSSVIFTIRSLLVYKYLPMSFMFQELVVNAS